MLRVRPRPFKPLRLQSQDTTTTTMNNSEGRMKKQNGHVSREWGGKRGAAGSVVQAPKGLGGGEQTWTDSMGQACSSGVGLRLPSGPWAGAVLGTQVPSNSLDRSPACCPGG